MSYYNGPKIVTNGLQLYLDAANPKSYPGSGTTWIDITGNGNNATLNNGLQTGFSTLYGGTFNFDNSDDYVSISNFNFETLGQSRSLTVMFGAYKKFYGTSGNNTGDSRVLQGSDNGYNQGYRIVEVNTGTPGAAFTGAQGFSYGYLNSGATIYDTVNRPAICAFSQNGNSLDCFINNSFGTGNMIAYTNGTNSGTMGGGGYGVGYFGGYISFLQVYNRALSRAEILQNYDATKTRFGL